MTKICLSHSDSDFDVRNVKTTSGKHTAGYLDIRTTLQEWQPWRNGGGGGAEGSRGGGRVRLLRVSAAVGPD